MKAIKQCVCVLNLVLLSLIYSTPFVVGICTFLFLFLFFLALYFCQLFPCKAMNIAKCSTELPKSCANMHFALYAIRVYPLHPFFKRASKFE